MARARVQLKPFMVPNFAALDIELSANATSGIPVKELDVDALNELAQEWLDALYAKCGRKSPFKLNRPWQRGSANEHV